jgi:DNA invertase Pin-like site-specific DNA recombinase
MPNIAYSYVRFSTPQQLLGNSRRRQIEASERYATENGLVLDQTLSDEGLSAFTGKNVRDGALGRFIEAIEKGKVRPGSYLLVESLDRLSRAQVISALRVFLNIIEAGIIIVTLADEHFPPLCFYVQRQSAFRVAMSVGLQAHAMRRVHLSASTGIQPAEN